MNVYITINDKLVEVWLGADDLAPIIADYYGIDEEKASYIISEFDLYDAIGDRWYDEVMEIAEEKWRCNYDK